MKKYIKVYLLMGLLCLNLVAHAQEKFKKYPIKSGKIEYELSGSISGSKIIYWDDFGYLEAIYEDSETISFGMKTPKKEVVVFKGAKQYTWNQKNSHVIMTDNQFAESFIKSNASDEEVIRFAEEMMIQMGFQKTEQEQILGKTCDVWTGIGKLWSWKGLTLKLDMNMMGVRSIETAKSIQLDIPIAKEKFELPKGLEVQTPFN